MSKAFWTYLKLNKMHDLKIKNKSWVDIGKEIGTSADSARKKFSRINWNTFFNKKENNDSTKNQGIWSQQDMLRLHTYLDAEKSYAFIAEKIGRTVIAVERKAQSTDWTAWLASISKLESENGVESVGDDQLIKNLVNAMVSLSRCNYSQIRDAKKDDFLSRINLEEKDLPISFKDIKELATKELDECGLGNGESIQFNEGTYVVVGDSHGKHTKRNMFNLISNINSFFNPEQIIHIGHILDDDNEISFKWGDFKNLTILAKEEELKFIHKKRNSHNFSYKIVRSDVQLGKDLTILNQDMISDYVKTPIGSLDTEIFGGKMIINCHRLEVSSKASSDDTSNYICSPGSICERHIIKTIKQIDFQDKKTVKVAFPDGFVKYRRMKHNFKYWNQGVLVIHVDKFGDHTVIPCIIKQYGKEYYTSYFDLIISSNGLFNPDKKIFIHADMHSPNHDTKILDIQEQICEDYKPDVLINIGDAFDVEALSHHDIDKGNVIFGDYLEESAKAYYVMKRMTNWAPKCHAIIGNHERFIQDFVKKFPQLASILDFEFVCDLKNSGYEITSLKDVLEIGDTKFIHGDMTFFNQSGTKVEKASRTLGHNTFIGHVHYPSIRFGCYSVGFAGLMDQGYNEPEASAWIHGLGQCNQYKGMSWPTTIAIFNYKLILNGKTYEPKNPDSWNLNGFKARIIYDNENQESNS